MNEHKINTFRDSFNCQELKVCVRISRLGNQKCKGLFKRESNIEIVWLILSPQDLNDSKCWDSIILALIFPKNMEKVWDIEIQKKIKTKMAEFQHFSMLKFLDGHALCCRQRLLN